MSTQTVQRKIDRLNARLDQLLEERHQLVVERNKLRGRLKKPKRKIADNVEVIQRLLYDQSVTYESLAKELNLTVNGLKDKVFWNSGGAARESGNQDIKWFHDRMFEPGMGPVKALKMWRGGK